MRKSFAVTLLAVMMLFAFSACNNNPSGMIPGIPPYVPGGSGDKGITEADDLVAALATGGTVTLGDDITLDAQIVAVADGTVIDGNGHTITFDVPANTKAAPSDNSIILVTGDNVTIKDLIIDGVTADTAVWNYGEFGIKVYNATGVVIEDVTVKNANAGIQVNSSDVTLKGNIVLDNNAWGGIGVDRSSDKSLPLSKLTVDAAIKYTGAADTEKPVIWVEAGAGSVSGTEGFVIARPTKDNGDVNQTWYMPSGTNSSDKVEVAKPFNASTTFEANGYYYLAADLDLNEQLTINAPNVVIDGNGKTISRKVAFDNSEETDKGSKAIMLVSSNATLRNLVVDGLDGNKKDWNPGEFGIKVYDADAVVLENITVKNANAGIQVNSSTVTIQGNIVVSGNQFGGIGVDKGSALEEKGSLTVAAGVNLVCDDTDVPAIWLESDENARIADNTNSLVDYTPTAEGKDSQTWYLTATQDVNFNKELVTAKN